MVGMIVGGALMANASKLWIFCSDAMRTDQTAKIASTCKIWFRSPDGLQG